MQFVCFLGIYFCDPRLLFFLCILLPGLKTKFLAPLCTFLTLSKKRRGWGGGGQGWNEVPDPTPTLPTPGFFFDIVKKKSDGKMQRFSKKKRIKKGRTKKPKSLIEKKHFFLLCQGYAQAEQKKCQKSAIFVKKR